MNYQYDPTINEVMNRPWPAPVERFDVLRACRDLDVSLRNGRIPRSEVSRVSYTVECRAAFRASSGVAA